MKNIYSAIAVAFAIISSAACTKTDVDQKQSENGPYEVTIIGEMGGFDVSTKSSVESVVRMKWNTTTTDADKDVVWVYGYDGSGFKSLGSLKATSTEANPYTALLSGSIDAIPSDNNLYLVHCPSGTYSQPAISTSGSTGSISFDMSTVVQSAGVTPFIIYSTVNVAGKEKELSGLTANFSFATSVVKVNLTGLGASAGLTKATVSNLNKNCSLSFSDGAVSVTAAPETPDESALGTFTKNLSGSATAGGKATFLLAVPAISASSDRKLTVTAGGKTYTENKVISAAHAANGYVNTICCVEEKISTGVFSISDTKRVKFTKGNLWWGVKSPADTSAFHFEANQYDYRTWQNSYSCIEGTVSETGTPSGNVGLFFWTTTAERSYAETYSDVSNPGYFFADGCEERTITVDNQGGCYLLSINDLAYIFLGRSCTNKYAKAKIKGVNGLLLFPDSYSGATSGTGISTVNSATEDYPAESIPDGTWTAMDEAGCVFLPVAHRRQYYDAKINVIYDNIIAYYWTSTSYNANNARMFTFHDEYIGSAGMAKNYGMPLRLVYDVD